jgi:hypothetical protein
LPFVANAISPGSWGGGTWRRAALSDTGRRAQRLRANMNRLSMNFRYVTTALVLAATMGLAACSKGRTVTDREYYDPRYAGPGQGSMTGDAPLFSLGKDAARAGDQSGAGLGVNAYLWRGALDTLSFMPLASADPFGGVIITDWYQPPAGGGERFKATAYILGKQLRADGVKVSLFRQVAQNGQWVDAPVSAATTGEIENRVLARARELRSQGAPQ